MNLNKMRQMQKLAGILNEKSFHSFNMSDIITDKYLKEYMLDDEVDYMLEVYMQDNDLEDEDEVRDSDEFKEFVKDELKEKLDDAMDNLYDSINDNGKIIIYRAMTVKDDWIEHLKTQGKRLGIYWSWNGK